MFINDIPLSDFGGKLLSRKISPLDIEITTFWPRKALRPFISAVKGYYYKRLDLEIELAGTPSQIEINKSRLIQALTSASVSFRKLDHVYTGVIAGTGVGAQVPGYEVIEAEMLVYQHETSQNVEINRSLEGIIYLDSNHETPAVIEILPSANVASVTITGLGRDIILSNLTAGKLVILDGENGIVTEDGLNKWPDYDSWGFPRLAPGENIIDLSDATLDITVRFSPRWA